MNISMKRSSRESRTRAGKTRKVRRNTNLNLESLEQRIVLAAPQFVSVQPNGGDVLTPAGTDILNISPRELAVRFDQDINPSASSLAGVQLLHDGVEVTNVSRDVGLAGNTVVLRLAETLSDDQYSINVTSALQNTQGETFDPSAAESIPLSFEVDLGTKVLAAVPQPFRSDGSGQALNEIDVYFDSVELDPSLVTMPEFYRLILTQDTVNNLDDSEILPDSVTVDGSDPSKVTLTFADSLHNLAGPNASGTFRLRIGTDEASPVSPLPVDTPAVDPGDSFATALDLTALGAASRIISSTIINPTPFPVNFPGANTEPGHVDPEFATHLLDFAEDGDADAIDGISVISYGFEPLLTEAQQQRYREALEIYGSIAGVDFVEAPGEGLLLFGNPSVNWDNEFLAPGSPGQPSFSAFASNVVSTLLLEALNGAALPPNTFSGDIRFYDNTSEVVVPTNNQIVHATHTFRPDSIDIDLYKFEISGSTSGLFSAEVFAERLPNVSLLDPVLRLYRETSSGPVELIGQNDDYFSEDSYMQQILEPGTYFVGISSTGNDQYDPATGGTGFGGTSQGDYELRLDFRPDVLTSLVDNSGVPLDGNGDGTPGGVFNFWFRTAAPSGEEGGQNEIQEFSFDAATAGTFTLEFAGAVTAPIAYDASAATISAELEALPGIEPGDVTVSGVLPDGAVTIEFTGNLAMSDVPELVLDTTGLDNGSASLTTLTEGRHNARIVYVDTTDTSPDDAATAGTAANPYNTIHAALNLDIDGLPQSGSSFDSQAARPGDIVRILSNETGDTYEIGLDSFSNQPLADGAKLDIPHDVTVMVDAGVEIELRRSAIFVGSTAVGIDHSKAALQVLGTPQSRVSFTSINPVSMRGDWGGMIFAGDLDRAEGRERYEDLGIFLDHVGHANISFGGGVVNVGSVPQEIAPIDIRESRPAVKFNTMSQNVAAISATPNSFEETNFHSPEFQSVPFASDYQRIGPDIQDNSLSGNSINGLFVRLETPAGSDLEKMTVAGRWDDAGIVHVVSEVLEIQGTPGGPLDPGSGPIARTDASLVVDPNVIVKLDGARIEIGVGAQLIAEGLDGQAVTFTSIQDDRFGAGGAFDTSNNLDSNVPRPGDWSGIYAGHSSMLSLDHALVTFGGGISAIEGGFVGFNAIEIQQSDARIANSTFVSNASGVGGTGSETREGRGTNGAAAIFVRGAQPVIVGNQIVSSGSIPLFPAIDPDEMVAAISINANSLNYEHRFDHGRSTGLISRNDIDQGNQGPLIRNNIVDDNDINGLLVRGETLSTESVWDDTDIVHVVFDSIHVPDFHTHGGLRLESSSTESLVVKLGGTNKVAGFDATGLMNNIPDRIGGSLHIIGQPGRPVILTSIADDSVGAGAGLEGLFVTQTMREGFGTAERPGNLNIDFNFSAEIADNPILVAGFEEAARFWESRLTDEVSLSFDVVIADTGSSPYASASSEGASLAYNDAIQLLQDDAAADEIDLLSRLPDFSQLTVQGPQGNSNIEVVDGVSLGYPAAKALGIDLPPVPSEIRAGATRDGQINMTKIFSRSGTIDGYASVMIHEIAHTLGFQSSVPEDGQFGGAVQLTAMDLFRMAPGAGAEDFTNNPRMLDQEEQQVFYDGGLYNPVGIDIAGITMGDIPVSRGEEFPDMSPHPDDAQPSHWRSQSASGINNINLGIMDPGAGSVVRDTDLRVLGLVGWNLRDFTLPEIATPGDWQGIELDQLSNDRNVDVITELESSQPGTTSTNSIPDRAENLGRLAESEYQGDDNLRLGFEVLGVINSPNDEDVYSFEGIAGTEVWLDIDRSASHLDTVVELVNLNGETLARSNDSLAEDQTGSSLVTAMPLVDVGGYYPHDHFSVNPLDAGMQLELPGAAGTRGTYFVRVSSHEGASSGAYELNLRLRDVDEVPGSVIKFADIRYAKTGIDIAGLVANSPLQSEFVEPGDTLSYDTALNLGDPFQSPRAEISVSGRLEQLVVDADTSIVIDGVDWYNVTLSSAVPGISIDIDYADGIGNPDTQVSVFRIGISEGPTADENDDYLTYDLVYFGDASAVEDDQIIDLSGGSFGLEDPFIGPVYPSLALDGNDGTEVVIGGTNRGIASTPSYLIAVSPQGANPEDLISQYARYTYIDQLTTAPLEFEAIDIIDLSGTEVPFSLNDFTLYVTENPGGGSMLNSVNPFTGEALQPFPRQIVDESVGYEVSSLGMRGDGLLFSLTLGDDDAESGNWLNVDWAQLVNDNGDPIATNAENLGDDGIVTYIEVPSDEDPPGDPAYEVFDDGIQFLGMTITDAFAFGVGERGAKDAPELAMGPEFTENIIYMLDAYPFEVDFNDTDPGTVISAPPNAPDQVRETEAESEFYFGTIPGPLTDFIEIGHFDTSVAGPGGLVQGLAAFGDPAAPTLYGVTDAGGLYEFNGSTTFLGAVPGKDFRSLTTGPADFAETLFAMTNSGELHAFDLAGTPQPVFDGATFVGTDASGVEGIAFSSLDRNLWVTGENLATFYADNEGFFSGNESTEAFVNAGFNQDYNFPGGAHGVLQFPVDLTPDDEGSRPFVYFEYQLRTENDELNVRDPGDPDDDVFNDTLRDVMRVYATSVDPSTALPEDWVLVASSNGFEDGEEIFDNSRFFIRDGRDLNGNGIEDVREQFFRQARVPLEEFVGTNTTLRIEFSTEGTFNEDRTGDAFGNYYRVPERTENGLTDNQIPEDWDDARRFLGVELTNVFFGNTERGEQVNRTIFWNDQDDTIGHPPDFRLSDGPLQQGDYQLLIRPAYHDSITMDPPDNLFETSDRFARFNPDSFDTVGFGDTNRFREQGQILVHSNVIENSELYGINVSTSPTLPAGASDLVTPNSTRQVRGPVLENNVVIGSGIAGIGFSGDDKGIGAVPFGRLMNNTIIGDVESPSGIGIEIGAHASPTLLNNLIAYTASATTIATSSESTVISGQLFHTNINNGDLGEFPIDTTGQDLFVDPEDGNFLLAEPLDPTLPGAIDSAVDSQEDRTTVSGISASLGLDFVSPILAPERDERGQLRIDDPNVETPLVLGGNVFKDRGALERADDAGPRSELLQPVDNSPIDMNPDLNDFANDDVTLGLFELRLFDLDISGNNLNGVGIDDETVVESAISVFRNGQQLAVGLDYQVSYNSTSDILRIIPQAGVWIDGAYEVVLDNTMITDLATNPLSANRTDGTTRFTISLNATQPTESWHNEDMPADVNDDGIVVAQDAIIVINEINLRRFSDESGRLQDQVLAPPFYDVNNDGFVAANDVIIIINEINQNLMAPLSMGVGGTDAGDEEWVIGDSTSTLSGDHVANPTLDVALRSYGPTPVSDVSRLIDGERDDESDESNVDAIFADWA